MLSSHFRFPVMVTTKRVPTTQCKGFLNRSQRKLKIIGYGGKRIDNGIKLQKLQDVYNKIKNKFYGKMILMY